MVVVLGERLALVLIELTRRAVVIIRTASSILWKMLLLTPFISDTFSGLPDNSVLSPNSANMLAKPSVPSECPKSMSVPSSLGGVAVLALA